MVTLAAGRPAVVRQDVYGPMIWSSWSDADVGRLLIARHDRRIGLGTPESPEEATIAGAACRQQIEMALRTVPLSELVEFDL